MKRNAIVIQSATQVLDSFFTDLAVAVAITVPLDRDLLALTARISSCILFLALAIFSRTYYEFKYYKRKHK